MKGKIKRLITDIHCWCITKLVGKKSVVMNCTFKDNHVMVGTDFYIYSCTFHLSKTESISGFLQVGGTTGPVGWGDIRKQALAQMEGKDGMDQR
jgi:hypothetical protein